MLNQTLHYENQQTHHERTMSAVIVSDDRDAAASLQRSLQNHHCRVVARIAGQEALQTFVADHDVDFVVIDLAMSGDGIELSLALRQQHAIPQVFLTAELSGKQLDELLQLEPLVYLTRPVNDAHVALIANLMRRLSQRLPHTPTQSPDEYLPLGDGFTYNHEMRSLYRHNEPVDLTPGERELFELCLHREGCVVPYEMIVDHVWHGKDVAESTRRGLYHRLRKKLGGTLFETVSGIGCRVRLPANR